MTEEERKKAFRKSGFNITFESYNSSTKETKETAYFEIEATEYNSALITAVLVLLRSTEP